jgi:serine/threonine protein kinase
MLQTLHIEKIFHSETKNLFDQDLNHLEFIHLKGFVCRDAKSENCLIVKDDHILLTDFGLSKKIEETTKTFCGTVSFIAPEMIQGNSYGFSADCWSYGILAYEVLTGKRPYEDEDRAKLLWKIVNTSPRFPAELDSDSQDFLIQFLKKNPTQRFTFNKSKKMKFWNGVDFTAVERKEVSLEFVPNEELSDEECCRMFFGENVKDDEVNKRSSLFVYPDVDRFSFVREEFQPSL